MSQQSDVALVNKKTKKMEKFQKIMLQVGKKYQLVNSDGVSIHDAPLIAVQCAHGIDLISKGHRVDIVDMNDGTVRVGNYYLHEYPGCKLIEL